MKANDLSNKEKGLLVGARYGFYFVPLHPMIMIYFLIEHLKRLPVMGGRFSCFLC